MHPRFTRRSFAAMAASLPGLLARQAPPPGPASAWRWTLPIGRPGDIPGNGFIMRHGFATENTSFYPGGWHTGENYYLREGNTAGAEVYAVADGEVVFAGFDYPGPVVIVRHADDLYSMYGHLAYELEVEGGPVTRGQRLGTVLDRTDGRSPSHLHVEVRRFLIHPEVNGPSPRYSFTCGPNCPPGPGYWPIDAPEHPASLGWMNPTHAVARRAFPDGVPATGASVIVAEGAPAAVPLWATPDAATPLGELPVIPGERFALREIDAGPDDSLATSAEGYRLWYRITVPQATEPVWVQALVPTADATGADGRPSSLRFHFLPDVTL